MKYTKFQDLSIEEKREVLRWRNHPEIRKWMYNKEKISLEKHLKFIDNLDKKRIYLKVGNLGTVNYKLVSDCVEFGIHKNPDRQKVGNKLLEFALKYAFKELKAKKIILYVFEDNLKALNLYKKFGFLKSSKKDNLIKMELKYEDWKS